MESVGDIMTKGQIVTCTPETSIDDGARATPPSSRFAARAAAAAGYGRTGYSSVCVSPA
jgi:hypothetical protein